MRPLSRWVGVLILAMALTVVVLPAVTGPPQPAAAVSGDAPAAADHGTHQHGSRDPFGLALLVADVVLVGAVVVVMCRRPRRAPGPRKPWKLEQPPR